MELNDIKKDVNSEEKEETFEETSLLLSIVDINLLQNIFIDLVDGYICSIYSIYEEEEIKKAFNLLLNFSLSCKLFFQISKQKIFPLILNNININLNYKKYFKILLIKQQVEKNKFYKEKDITDIFYCNCSFGYYQTINTLIKYGANVQYLRGYTLLTTATLKENIQTIKKLVTFKNLNINETHLEGNTALICACENENEDIVKILLSRKDIDINIKDEFGPFQKETIMKI